MDDRVVFNEEWARERIEAINKEIQILETIDIRLRLAEVDESHEYLVKDTESKLMSLESALRKTATAMENYINRMDIAQSIINNKIKSVDKL